MVQWLSLALRSLRARPSRTLLTTAGIVLGVAVIFAISITNESTLHAVTSVFGEAAGNAHLIISSSDTSGEGFPEEIRRRVIAVPGVRAAVPTLQIQTMLEDTSESLLGGFSMMGPSFGGLTVYGIDPKLEPDARDYNVVAGEFLPDDLDAYEILLVDEYAKDNDIELGGDVILLTPTGPETLRVIGLLSKDGTAQRYNGAFGIMPLRAAQRVFFRAGSLDQIDIIATADAATGGLLDALKAAVQDRLGDAYSVTFPATQGERVSQMLTGYQMGLNFFSVIALFVGAFLIYNTFSMTVAERTREIGMLRTLGMTQAQVMRQILLEAALLAVLGCALGLAMGVVLSRGMTLMMEMMVAQKVEEVQLPLGGLVLSAGVGFFVTLAAVALPARNASRISPLEALRARGIPRESWFARRGWLPGTVTLIASYWLIEASPFPPEIQYQLVSIPVFGLFVGATLLVPATVGMWERASRPLVRLIYGNEGRLGSSNIRRSRMRTAMTVAMLMIGVAMILGLRSMTAAFKKDITSWMDTFIGGDLWIFSSLSMRTDLGPRLEAVEGVAAVTPQRMLNVSWITPDGTSEEIQFTAIDPVSYRRVTSVIGTDSEGDSEQLLDRLAQGDAAFNVFAQESVAPDWRPTASGVAFTAEGITRTLVAVAGGLAIVAFGYRAMFLIVAVTAASAALLFWAYFRGPRGEPAP